jgi:hypothetical protein
MKWPTCEICGRGMSVGQIGRHYVCDPKHPAYQAPATTPFERAVTESQRSADAKWTTSQQTQVDQAIRKAATQHSTFTADQIWRLLPAGFPVTKGLAARLVAAARSGLIRNTGQTAIANRGGQHDHAQRLAVWASLIYSGPAADLFAEQGQRH